MKSTKNVGARILCVDDSAVNLRLLSSILSEAGYQVTCVTDGSEALNAVLSSELPYQVLITDHDMPKMKGLDLIARLKEISFPGKIILNSATLTEEDLRLHHDPSVVTMLGKPVDRTKLLALIKSWVS